MEYQAGNNRDEELVQVLSQFREMWEDREPIDLEPVVDLPETPEHDIPELPQNNEDDKYSPLEMQRQLIASLEDPVTPIEAVQTALSEPNDTPEAPPPPVPVQSPSWAGTPFQPEQDNTYPEFEPIEDQELVGFDFDKEPDSFETADRDVFQIDDDDIPSPSDFAPSFGGEQDDERSPVTSREAYNEYDSPDDTFSVPMDTDSDLGIPPQFQDDGGMDDISGVPETTEPQDDELIDAIKELTAAINEMQSKLGDEDKPASNIHLPPIKYERPFK